MKKNKILECISDDVFIQTCRESQSMAQAARILNIPFTTFSRKAKTLGCYKTNQAGKGIERNVKSKFSVCEDYFQHWTPQSSYWYGFIVADGCVLSSSKHLFRIRVTRSCEYVLDRFKEDVKFTGQIRRGTTKASTNSDKTYQFSDIAINNKQFVESLRKLNIAPNKTYIDFQYINNVPEQYRPYFLVGLFDGDGCISKSGYISIAGNKSNIVSSLSINGFNDDQIYCKDKGNYVDVHIRTKKDCLRFYDMYLECCKQVKTLNHKREAIEKQLCKNMKNA